MSRARKLVSGALLGLGALLLALGGVMHAMAFQNASKIADLSTLPLFFASAFKGLWLTDSVSSIALGFILALAAARPQWIARPVRVLLALLPTALAVIIFATMGNFFAGYLMLTAGAAALGGALTSAVFTSSRTATASLK